MFAVPAIGSFLLGEGNRWLELRAVGRLFVDEWETLCDSADWWNDVTVYTVLDDFEGVCLCVCRYVLLCEYTCCVCSKSGVYF